MILLKFGKPAIEQALARMFNPVWMIFLVGGLTSLTLGQQEGHVWHSSA